MQRRYRYEDVKCKILEFVAIFIAFIMGYDPNAASTILAIELHVLTIDLQGKVHLGYIPQPCRTNT